MTPPREIIHRELRAWAPLFVHNRMTAARAAGLVATEELIRSMRSEVTSALQDVQRFLFAMEKHGRILDMRRRRQAQPPIAELVAWVEAVGVERFRPGFVRRHGTAPDDRRALANAIAWGIARKRTNRTRRHRWYAKDKETDIGALYERLMTALQLGTLQDQKTALQ